MRKSIGIAACAAALMLLAGCGGEESRVPSAEDNEKMNGIAAELDANQTLDTSPDSLVVDEGQLGNSAVEDGAAAANEAEANTVNAQ